MHETKKKNVTLNKVSLHKVSLNTINLKKGVN